MECSQQWKKTDLELYASMGINFINIMPLLIYSNWDLPLSWRKMGGHLNKIRFLPPRKDDNGYWISNPHCLFKNDDLSEVITQRITKYTYTKSYLHSWVIGIFRNYLKINMVLGTYYLYIYIITSKFTCGKELSWNVLIFLFQILFCHHYKALNIGTYYARN